MQGIDDFNAKLSEWAAIGPFGSTLAHGFDRQFPPEWEIDLRKQYEGWHGPIRWRYLHADPGEGLILLAGPCWPEISQIPILPLKEYEIGYLYTNLRRQQAADALLAINSPFKMKMWLNCEPVYRQDNLWAGEAQVAVHLQEGENHLLLKIEKLLWWEWKLRISIR